MHLANGKENAIDEERILAIVAIEAMSVALDFHMLGRRVMSAAVPRTAQERHVAECGHLLAFGCCRGGNRFDSAA